MPGPTLSDLVAAGALANARAHGGTNYNGYHALMALMPSYEMCAQMPGACAALPVLKVLHRNARFIQDVGHAHTDALEPLAAGAGEAQLVESVRARDLPQAERSLARLEEQSRGTRLRGAADRRARRHERAPRGARLARVRLAAAHRRGAGA